MATPQPMKHVPSQQGKTPQYAAATPGASASTPYSNLHAAFSPHGGGPKSSPQQIKKSPANAASAMMMSTSNSQQGTSGPGTAPPMNFDSPSANAAFNNMLGMGGFDTSLENMGMGAIGLPRPTGDEERQKRLDEVTHVLNQKRGIVSEEGIERLANRLGLDILWEDKNLPIKELLLGGKTLTLEIGIKDHMVHTVSLQYAFSSSQAKDYASKAEAILLQELRLEPEQHPWTKSLDSFANNLERLTILDKLSVLNEVNEENEEKGPILNTHDAIAGLYDCLNRVHEWDVKQMHEDPNYYQKPDEYLRTIATCERNGRPLMHESGIVGMSIKYWRDQRYHLPPPQQAESWYKNGKSWSILVSCARRDPMVYSAAVRMSNRWIGDEVEIPATDGLPPMLNWQEPPDVVLPDKPGDELLLAGPKLPEVMFIAVFNPPVTLPSTVWEQMLHFTGAPILPPAYMHTFDYLIFPADGDYNQTEPRMIESRRVLSAKSKRPELAGKIHENRLFVHKPVYGQTLTELPFSHPSQLVNMLPTLRQYAFLWNLLDKAFNGQTSKSTVAGATSPSASKVTARSSELDIFINNVDADTVMIDAYNKVVKQSTDPDAPPPVKVDVTLNAHPQPNPKLQIMFPFQNRPAQVTVDIGRNGIVQIESTNIVDDEGQVLDGNGNALPDTVPNSLYKKERLARLLMFFEDINLWCEWIRMNVG